MKILEKNIEDNKQKAYKERKKKNKKWDKSRAHWPDQLCYFDINLVYYF